MYLHHLSTLPASTCGDTYTIPCESLSNQRSSIPISCQGISGAVFPWVPIMATVRFHLPSLSFHRILYLAATNIGCAPRFWGAVLIFSPEDGGFGTSDDEAMVWSSFKYTNAGCLHVGQLI